MSDFPNLSDEAKAALARAAEKSVDPAFALANRVGDFLYRVVGGLAEDAVGIHWDNIKFRRFENKVRSIEKAEKIWRERGVETIRAPLPINFAIPLLEAAGLQEDEALSDLYARLLANALDPNRNIEPDPIFLRILQSLQPLDALIIERVYSAVEQREFDKYDVVYTGKLPQEVHFRQEMKEREGGVPDYGEPSQEVEMALWKLCSLSCLGASMNFGGGALVGCVGITMLGYRFYQACKQ